MTINTTLSLILITNLMLYNMKDKEVKELYLRDKVKELHDVVINMIDEIENELELSDPMGQDIISLLHHIECETCI